MIALLQEKPADTIENGENHPCALEQKTFWSESDPLWMKLITFPNLCCCINERRIIDMDYLQ